jgi:hypothetical protein
MVAPVQIKPNSPTEPLRSSGGHSGRHWWGPFQQCPIVTILADARSNAGERARSRFGDIAACRRNFKSTPAALCWRDFEAVRQIVRQERIPSSRAKRRPQATLGVPHREHTDGVDVGSVVHVISTALEQKPSRPRHRGKSIQTADAGCVGDDVERCGQLVGKQASVDGSKPAICRRAKPAI